MSYARLIWSNVARNKRRSILTGTSVGLALIVLSTLLAFLSETERRTRDASPLRLVTRHAVSLANFLPERYRAKIEAAPGVVAVTPMSWIGANYIDEASTDFAQFSCDPKTLFEVYPEYRVSPGEKNAFIREKTAALVGRNKAEKHGWKLGDRIHLKGNFYPVDLDLVVRGVFSANANEESVIYIHDSYLKEALGQPGVDGIYRIRADSAQSVPRIIEMVDAAFQNTDAPTRTETERAHRMGFISMLGNLRGLAAYIGGAVIFTILLVTTNAMGMSIRERTREIAVLKALGFNRWRALWITIAEGLIICIAGGLAGLLTALAASSFIDIGAVTDGAFERLDFSVEVFAIGLAVSAFVGAISVAIPCLNAVRLTVADGLRHVG